MKISKLSWESRGKIRSSKLHTNSVRACISLAPKPLSLENEFKSWKCMYGNCRVDALDSQLISYTKMCAGFPPSQVVLFSLFLEKGILVVWCNSGEVRFKERGNANCIEW